MFGVRDTYRIATRITLVLLLVVAVVAPLEAQYGTAPNGFYPETYNGSMFEGVLESVDPAKQEFTLLYRKKDKEQRFLGRLEDGCSVPNAKDKTRKMKVEDFPKQSTIVALFKPKTEKQTDGSKVKFSSVFAISFREVNGQRIKEEDWIMYYCMKLPAFREFRVF